MSCTTPEYFTDLVAELTAHLQGRFPDAALEQWLNTEYSAGSDFFQRMRKACEEGDAQGWLCQHVGGGIRYGRAIKPSELTHNFSVDVVDMEEVVGPHHVHPNGEIDLVIPVSGDARFDGQGAGWKVYPPGSAHRPTVRGGRAYVVYLLPEGAIQFTRT